jgi:hypothetical protein
MAINSLFPSYVQFFYHSAYGQHVQTIPTESYDSGADTFEAWGGVDVDRETMFTPLIAAMMPFYPETVTYDSWRIFTLADPDATPLLANAGVFTSSNVGTEDTPGWTKAVQGTFSYLGSGGSKGRLNFMDSISGNNFDPQFTTGPSGILVTLLGVLSDDAYGWSTRGGEQPTTFLQYSKTLNEKLRREYRMF